VQQVASVVADQANSSMTFGEVLQGANSQPEPINATSDSSSQLNDLQRQFVDSARKVMASLGIAPDEAVLLDVDASGRIEVSSGNSPAVQDKAAQIEAVLSADSSLSQMAKQVLSASGGSQATIRLPSTDNLTIPLSQANIGQRLGG
jgi:hypothetical protein